MVALVISHKDSLHIGHVRVHGAVVKPFDIEVVAAFLCRHYDVKVGICRRTPSLRVIFRAENLHSVAVHET